MQHSPVGATEGPEALGISIIIAAATCVLVLGAAALAGRTRPASRAFFDPLNLLILLTQALDGATTWIGVTNPFNLKIPTFQETVFISNIVIGTFGGVVYYVLKVLLGVGVILTLAVAARGTGRERDRYLVLFVQLTLVVIGAIPVFNNTANFLYAA